MTAEAMFVHQVARPDGMPRPEDFAFVTEPLPAPRPGTALVENIYLSVDPYMRECMDELWELNSPLEGRAIGRVVDSRDPGLKAGDLVFHRDGWRTHTLVGAAGGPASTGGGRISGGNAVAGAVRVLPEHPGVPVGAYLGILGGTGLTAFVALTRIARVRAGESIFISGAAGGVGTAAGQIARLLGAGRVVGSAGSAAKVRHLIEDLGFDAAFDYHDGPLGQLLAQAAPDGVDVCVENVGGEHLEAAIGAVRPHGRIAWVGAVSQYNHPQRPPTAPRNLYDVVGKSIRLEGFLVRDYRDLQEEMENFLVPHLRSGRITSEQTVVDGFSGIVDAFLGMLQGRNTGKMIVQV